MCAESVEQSQWYTIQTRSRHEKVVRDQLAAKRITPLLPLLMRHSSLALCGRRDLLRQPEIDERFGRHTPLTRAGYEFLG